MSKPTGSFRKHYLALCAMPLWLLFGLVLSANLSFANSASQALFRSSSYERAQAYVQKLRADVKNAKKNFEVIDEQREVKQVVLGPLKAKPSASQLEAWVKKRSANLKVELRRINNKEYIFISKATPFGEFSAEDRQLISTLAKASSLPLKTHKKSVKIYVVQLKPQDQGGKVLTFGSSSFNQVKSNQEQSSSATVWTSGGRGVVETGLFTNNDVFSFSSFALINGHLQYLHSPKISARLGLELRYYLHNGKIGDIGEQEINLENTSITYRGANSKLSIGSLLINWGKMYEGSTFDILSRDNFKRLWLDAYENRKQPRLALRYEHYSDSGQLDFVLLPMQEPAILPDINSPWSLVDIRRGEIAGVDSALLNSTLVKRGSFEPLRSSAGLGAGVRWSKSSPSLDWSATLLHVAESSPYYVVNPKVLAAIIALGGNIDAAISAVNEPTFLAKSASPIIAGVDGVFEWQSITWRFESAYASARSVTNKNDFSYMTMPELRSSFSLEYFPNDSDMELNIRLASNQLVGEQSTWERKSENFMLGMLKDQFWNNRWDWSVLFRSSLSSYDIYVSPRVRYLGKEPHKFYLNFHHFDGERGSIGSFYSKNQMLSAGWEFSF